MAEGHEVEFLAFQLILQKLAIVEGGIQAMLPLLKQVISLLEAQSRQPEIPIATYAQLYPELEESHDSGEEPLPLPVGEAAAPSPLPRGPHRWFRWFLKES